MSAARFSAAGTALRALLLDLDGTLIDSLEDIGVSLNAVLERRRLKTHDLESYRTFIGEGVRVLVERALPASEHRNVDDVIAEYRAVYRERMLTSSPLYDGVDELIRTARDAGLVLAVLSNKPDLATRTIVEARFPAGTFAAVVGEREGHPRKPDPRAALSIAREIGIANEACAIIGDSRYDVECGRAAQMGTIGALWGFRGREELLDAGADVLAENPRDAATVIRRWTVSDRSASRPPRPLSRGVRR